MLGALKRNLSPLGLQTAAMLLLSYIAQQAEGGLIRSTAGRSSTISRGWRNRVTEREDD